MGLSVYCSSVFTLRASVAAWRCTRFVCHGGSHHPLSGPAMLALRALTFLSLAPYALSGQSVRVTVLDAESAAPIPGAIVSLHRPDGTRLNAALVNERGIAELRAPAAAEVRATAEQIGYESGSSSMFTVVPEGNAVELRLRPRALALAAIDVRSTSTCGATGSGGSAAAELWDQVRKALTAVTMVGSPGAGLSAWTYERDLDPSSSVLTESTAPSPGQRAGFITAPPAQLSRDGFTRTIDGATMYYAPDARLLLSDEFVRDHCFGIRATGGGATVGLTFEPVPGRRVADVRGVLWVEGATGAPRELEYVYTERAATVDGAGGRMQFTVLPNGQWVVERWSIRLPRVARIRPQRSRFGETGARDTLLGFHEEGGWLALNTPQSRSGATMVLQGVIYDSIALRPLFNARVVLAGGAAMAVTDTAGRYRMETPLPGRYAVAVLHPRLAQFGLEEQVRFATVSPGRVNRFDAAVPSPAAMRSHMCGPEKNVEVTFALLVQVIDSITGAPREGAQVAVSQRSARLRRSGGTALAAMVDSLRDVTADDRGIGVFCGLPVRDELQVIAEAAGLRAEHTFLPSPQAGLQELTLNLSGEGAAREARRLRVVGRSGDALLPLVGAEVRVMTEARSWVTGPDGGIALSVLGPARIAIVIRSIGYVPRVVEWTGQEFTGVQGDVVLERAVTTLSEVNVTARRGGSARLRDFEERRARGSGYFLGREELGRREASPLSSVLSSASGVRVERERDGRVYVVSTRSRALGGKACYAQIYLDGARVFSPGDLGPLGDGKPPSIESFLVVGLEAVEVYDGPTVTPIQYGGLGASCGTVLLWTRDGSPSP